VNIVLDSRVIGAHGEDIGTIVDVIISQSAKEITHIVVEEQGKAWTKVVPITSIASSDVNNKVVQLNIHKDAILFYGDFSQDDYHEVDIDEVNPKIHPYKGYVLTHKPEGEKEISRRKFLAVANLALLLAIIAGLFYPFLKYIIYPMYAGFNNAWYKIANVSDIPAEKDTPKLIKFIKVSKQAYMTNTEEKSHWIINASPELLDQVYGEKGNRVFSDHNASALWENTKENGLIVYSGKCTHLGCPYRWDEVKKAFVCPCHVSIFNLKGEVLSGPAPRRLDTLPVKLDDGQVYVIDAEYKAAVDKKERIA
jgi:Rieske Fe-S protein/sporulation protein YlmC with PRC-barrel domain